MTLSNIFSHLNYSEKALPPPKVIREGSKQDSLPSYDESAVTVRNQVHDEFMNSILDTARKEWGVTIGDLSVDNIHVVNAGLAADLKQRALNCIKVDTNRQNSEAAQQTQVLQARAEAEAAKYNAQAKQSAVLAEAEAAAQVVVYEAKARADSQKIANEMAIEKAKADAEALAIKAKGEASAARIRFELECDMKVAQAKADAQSEISKAEARKAAIEMEASALSKLDENALKIRMWAAQVEIAKEMYANQRTFVDTSNMPTMAQMLNLQALSAMGLTGLGMGQQSQQPALQPDSLPKQK